MIHLVMAAVGFMFALVALPMLRDIDRWLDRRAHARFVENVGWWIDQADPFAETLGEIRALPDTSWDEAERAARGSEPDASADTRSASSPPFDWADEEVA